MGKVMPWPLEAPRAARLEEKASRLSSKASGSMEAGVLKPLLGCGELGEVVVFDMVNGSKCNDYTGMPVDTIGVCSRSRLPVDR